MENTLSQSDSIRLREAWPALLGPLALGAALGFSTGVHAMVRNSLLLPASVVGLVVGMAPALYIGLSLVGAGPSARDVAHATFAALRAAGLVMAGTAPAALFLAASTGAPDALDWLAATLVGTALALGLRKLAKLLFAERLSLGSVAVYGAWALVAGLLEADLVARALGWGGMS